MHWSVAISFCILGLTGLLMLFGKHVLLPVIGYTLFAWLTNLGKNLHNFVAPLFMVSVAAMIVLYIRHNLPKRLRPEVPVRRLRGDGQGQAHPVGQVQRRREGLVLGRRGGAERDRELERR